MVLVCPSSPGGVCVCVAGLACLAFSTGGRTSGIVRVPGPEETQARDVTQDPLAECGHIGRGARWLVWWRSLQNVLRNVMTASLQCFDMPETDFPFCSGCELRPQNIRSVLHCFVSQCSVKFTLLHDARPTGMCVPTRARQPIV